MNSKTLKDLVKTALKKLEGDWVIIGGSVLPLVDQSYRTTVDIDMVPVADQGNSSLLSLMELASSLKLPVESINSAGLFFLKKIPGWQKRLVVHAESKKCRILRPSLDLYLELKISRLSESDHSDILAYLKWHKKTDEAFESAKCVAILERELKKSREPEKKAWLLSLLKQLR